MKQLITLASVALKEFKHFFDDHSLTASLLIDAP